MIAYDTEKGRFTLIYGKLGKWTDRCGSLLADQDRYRELTKEEKRKVTERNGYIVCNKDGSNISLFERFISFISRL